MLKRHCVTSLFGLLGLLYLLFGGCQGPVSTPRLMVHECTGYPKPTVAIAVLGPADWAYYEEPRYPRLAEQAGLEGTVAIMGLFGSSGYVQEAEVYESSGTPSLDDAALAAAYKCRLNPSVMGGDDCLWAVWNVEFVLEP